MTWPADVSTTNIDSSSDSPAAWRTDGEDLSLKFNQLRNHVTVFAQSLLDDLDAAAARATLGLAIGSNVPSLTGAGASGTWPINISGNAPTSGTAGYATNANYATTAGNGGVTSVNGMTGAVSVTSGVTSINGQTGAVVQTSQDAIGAVEALMYGSMNNSLVAGALYAGSALRRGYTAGSDPFVERTILTGGTCSGTWRCMGGVVNSGGGAYSVGLFVRVS